jgi:hypothetical protein
MATGTVTIDGTSYTVTLGLITVQDLINLTVGATPSTTFGINRHSLTVITDTGGTAPQYLDVEHNTINGHYICNIRGGEAYATSTAPSAGTGCTKQ